MHWRVHALSEVGAGVVVVLHGQTGQSASRSQAVFLEGTSVASFGLVQRRLAEDVVLPEQRPALVA